MHRPFAELRCRGLYLQRTYSSLPHVLQRQRQFPRQGECLEVTRTVGMIAQMTSVHRLCLFCLTTMSQVARVLLRHPHLHPSQLQ